MGDAYVVFGYAVTYGSIVLYAATLIARLRRRSGLLHDIEPGDSRTVVHGRSARE